MTFRHLIATGTAVTIAFLAAPTIAMDFTELVDFTERYAAAWSSGDPEQVASLYSPNGSLTVNDGEPAVGREAIAEVARGYMEGFPDMKVEMRAMQETLEGAEFHWRWTGTNTGPGGTGRAVSINGKEDWTFDDNGLILTSQGQYNEAEYKQQLGLAE